MLKEYQGKIQHLEARVASIPALESTIAQLRAACAALEEERSTAAARRDATPPRSARSPRPRRVAPPPRAASPPRRAATPPIAPARSSPAVAPRQRTADEAETARARRLEELHRAHSAKKREATAARVAVAAAGEAQAPPLPLPPTLTRVVERPRARRTPPRRERAALHRTPPRPKRTPLRVKQTPPRALAQRKTPPVGRRRGAGSPLHALSDALGVPHGARRGGGMRAAHSAALSAARSPLSVLSAHSYATGGAQSVGDVADLVDLIDTIDAAVEHERANSDAASQLSRELRREPGAARSPSHGVGSYAAAGRNVTPESAPRSIASFYARARPLSVAEQTLALWDDSSGEEWLSSHRDGSDYDEAIGAEEDMGGAVDEATLETHGRGRESFSPWRGAGVKRSVLRR